MFVSVLVVKSVVNPVFTSCSDISPFCPFGFSTVADPLQKPLSSSIWTDKISELENLTKKIAHVIQQAIGLSVKVKLVEPKTIERSMGKAVHVIDKRKLV